MQNKTRTFETAATWHQVGNGIEQSQAMMIGIGHQSGGRRTAIVDMVAGRKGKSYIWGIQWSPSDHAKAIAITGTSETAISAKAQAVDALANLAFKIGDIENLRGIEMMTAKPIRVYGQRRP